jgi:hypothetical protein
MNMIILAYCDNGDCGCESEEAFFFDDSMTDEEIIEEILYCAQEHAEAYSYVHFGWGESYTEEEYEEYLENYVNFNWRPATYEEYLDWCDNWGYRPKTEEEIVEYLSV